jgi:hypothetical protein
VEGKMLCWRDLGGRGGGFGEREEEEDGKDDDQDLEREEEKEGFEAVEEDLEHDQPSREDSGEREEEEVVAEKRREAEGSAGLRERDGRGNELVEEAQWSTERLWRNESLEVQQRVPLGDMRGSELCDSHRGEE